MGRSRGLGVVREKDGDKILWGKAGLRYCGEKKVVSYERNKIEQGV